MNLKKLSVVVAVGGLIMSGLASCTHRLTDFTVISTKNVPIGEGSPIEFQKGTKRVKGQDVAHTVLFLPIGFPNMKEAIDKAIEQVPGAVGLVDGVVKSSGWSCLFYGQNRYIVEGTPLFPINFDLEEPESRRPSGYNRNNINTGTENIPVSNTPASSIGGYIFFHEVKDGETISSIAEQYSVSVGELIKWNQLSQNTLSKGQKLKIHIKE